MKIVFIQPNVGFKGHTWEALGIGYLSAYLKQCMTVDIAFYSGFYDTDNEIIEGCKDAGIIGFSCTSPQFKHGLKLARQIKTKHNKIVFGGIHATALCDEVIKEKNIDVVILGEGEYLIKHYVDSPRNGIWLGENVIDINSLPFPDRFVIKNERNIQQSYRDNGERITSILSSRGCPFNCSFCCSHILWGRKIRFRTPYSIIKEMEELVNVWHIDFIKFADDTFTVDKQRIIDLCITKKRYGLDVPFGANAHINTVDAELLEYLKESNCRELWYGVESGSPEILKAMNKHTDLERIRQIFKLTKEKGIKTRAYFLLGMPQEAIKDIELTEKLCDEIEPDEVGFTLLSPFPCNDYFTNEMKLWDWSSFDEYNNDWVKTETLSNKQLKNVQKRLIEKYKIKATFRQKVKI